MELKGMFQGWGYPLKGFKLWALRPRGVSVYTIEYSCRMANADTLSPRHTRWPSARAAAVFAYTKKNTRTKTLCERTFPKTVWQYSTLDLLLLLCFSWDHCEKWICLVERIYRIPVTTAVVVDGLWICVSLDLIGLWTEIRGCWWTSSLLKESTHCTLIIFNTFKLIYSLSWGRLSRLGCWR